MKQLLLNAQRESSLPHLSLAPPHPSSLHPNPSVNADIDLDSFTPRPVLFVSLVSLASQPIFQECFLCWPRETVCSLWSSLSLLVCVDALCVDEVSVKRVLSKCY